jgi:hypothetical protein
MTQAARAEVGEEGRLGARFQGAPRRTDPTYGFNPHIFAFVSLLSKSVNIDLDCVGSDLRGRTEYCLFHESLRNDAPFCGASGARVPPPRGKTRPEVDHR